MGRRGEMKSRRWRRQQQFFLGKGKCLTGATKIVVKELLFLLPCKLLKQLSHVSFYLGKNMGKAKLSWARNSFLQLLREVVLGGQKEEVNCGFNFAQKSYIGQPRKEYNPRLPACTRVQEFFLPSSLGPPRKSENQKYFYGAVGGELEVILVEEEVGGIGISLSPCGSHFGHAKGS